MGLDPPSEPQRRRLLGAAVLVAGALLARPAPAGPALPQLPAQPRWPAGAIRILLVYPPGGVSDGILRLLAEQLSGLLGVPVQVVYRPGASGSLGLEALATAAPDGHTLAFTALTPLTLYPQLAKVRYDPLRDIQAVASVMLTPSLLVGTPAFGGHSVADLRTSACATPGQLRWATTGAGTTGHLVLAQWQRASGCAVTHIPYKGGGQQLNDALAGHFELLSTNMAAAQLQYIRKGRFKPLAVGAPQRLPSLPEVPTWAELGLPAANLASVFCLVAPAGTPAPLVQLLNEAVNQALASPAMVEALRKSENLPMGGGVDQLAALVRQEHAQHRLLLQATPIKLD